MIITIIGHRPHLAPGNLTPNEFLKNFEEKKTKFVIHLFFALVLHFHNAHFGHHI
jgi:hypothetical protein